MSAQREFSEAAEFPSQRLFFRLASEHAVRTSHLRRRISSKPSVPAFGYPDGNIDLNVSILTKSKMRGLGEASHYVITNQGAL